MPVAGPPVEILADRPPLGTPRHATLFLDATGTVRAWGDSAQDITGVDGAEGRRLDELALEPEVVHGLLDAAFERGTWLEARVAFQAVPATAYVRSLADADGSLTGYVVVLCDATREDRASEAQRHGLRLMQELGRARDLETGLEAILESAGPWMGARAAEAWFPGLDGSLRRLGTWAVDARTADALEDPPTTRSVARGEDLPGRAVLRRQRVHFRGLARHPAFARRAMARRAAFSEAWAVPLGEDGFEGALVFFDPQRSPDDEPVCARTLEATLPALRALAEREDLTKSGSALRGVFAHVQECALIQLDASGHIVECNDGATRLYGARRSQLLGLHSAALFPEGEADEGVPERELHYAAHDGPQDRECWQRRLDGRDFQARRVAGAVWSPERELEGYWVFAMDLTPREVAARAEARMRELSESNATLERFAVQASHDLSEPLQVMKACLDAVREEVERGDRDEAKVFVDHAREECGRLSGLVRGLLRLARVHGGALARTACDLEAAVERVKRRLETRIDAVDAIVTTGRLGTVEADPDLLEHLLQNLVENALKHHGEGTPRVHIEAVDGPSGPIVSVADDGPGVDEADMERLFQPLERGPSPSEGIGLGLALCRLITERHGGRIWVEPREGGGARFRFTLSPMEGSARQEQNGDAGDLP